MDVTNCEEKLRATAVKERGLCIHNVAMRFASAGESFSFYDVL